MKNTILKNIISFSFGNIISKLLLFIFGIIVARVYGVDVYGQYNYAVTVVSYFIMFAGMGIQSYAVYLISGGPDKLKEYYSKILSINLFFGIVFTILLLMFVIVIPTNFIMVIIAGSTILINAFNIDWVFKAKRNFRYISIQIILIGFIQLLILFCAYVFNFKNFYIVPVSVSVAQFAGNLFLLFKGHRIFDIRFLYMVSGWSKLIQNGLPFMFSGIFAGINCNIDIVFLGNLMNDSAVGCYSAAYKLINMLTMIVSIVFAPIFPEIVESFAKKELNEISLLVCGVFKSLLILIIPAATGGIMIGDKLLIFLYHINNSEIKSVFFILIIYTVIFCIREVYGYLLSASGNQKKYMGVTCISAVFNIILNLVLIPVLGIKGAAFATLFSEFTNLVLMKYFATKIAKISFVDLQLGKICFCTIIMGVCILFTGYFNLSVISIILISVFVYFLALHIAGVEVKTLLLRKQ